MAKEGSMAESNPLEFDPFGKRLTQEDPDAEYVLGDDFASGLEPPAPPAQDAPLSSRPAPENRRAVNPFADEPQNQNDAAYLHDGFNDASDKNGAFVGAHAAARPRPGAPADDREFVHKGTIPDWLEPLVIRNGGTIPAKGDGFSWAAFFWGFLYFAFRGQWKLSLVVLGLSVFIRLVEKIFPSIQVMGGVSIGVGLPFMLVLMIMCGRVGNSVAFVGAPPGKYDTAGDLRRKDQIWVSIALVPVCLFIGLYLILLFLEVLS